jgi:hypothetical protein
VGGRTGRETIRSDWTMSEITRVSNRPILFHTTYCIYGFNSVTAIIQEIISGVTYRILHTNFEERSSRGLLGSDVE